MPGGFMVVGDSYIRRHIIPGGIDAVYGQNTYYGQKVLFPRAQARCMLRQSLRETMSRIHSRRIFRI